MNQSINIIFSVTVFLFCVASGVHCQDHVSLPRAEANLQTLFASVSVQNSDEENKLSNDSIAFLLEKTLHLSGAFEYPFDSLKYLGKITSDDKKVRIFTWNFSHKDATNEYFGFILHRMNNNSVEVHRLTDSSRTMTNPVMTAVGPGNWYGCLIYGIVETKNSGETWYTLLGYDPENIFVTRKLVDILWFNNNMPVFGKPVFHYNKQAQNRILFEYSAKVRMSLTWNNTMKMIVFDHLSPSNPSYTGNYQYYGPDLSFDALSFDKGIWELKENVDVRN